MQALGIGYALYCTNDNQKQITDHISRLEGQLASVKKELQQNSVDCMKASTTLLSA